MGLDLTTLSGWANSNSVYGIDVNGYSKGVWVYCFDDPNNGTVFGTAINVSSSATVARIKISGSPFNITPKYVINTLTVGRWSSDVTFPQDEWHHIGVTVEDKSDVTKDPVIYLDGEVVAITEDTTPIGVLLPGTVHAVSCGRGQGGSSQLSGTIIAEVTFHDIVLSSDEMAYLPWAPWLVRPESLKEYWPMWGEERSGTDYFVQGKVQEAHLNAVGTTLTALHPPVRPYTAMPWGKGVPFVGRKASAGRVADRERRLSPIDGGLVT